jgi:GNAT superfamily N-acetyltransferase
MKTQITLRPLQPDDSKSLQEMFAASPDTGRFAIAPEYQIDFYRALVELGADTTGVVATVTGDGQLVGVGLVDIQDRCLDGILSPCALLHSLNVHPAYRQQGIATQLARWRIDYIRQQFGEEATILALIQNGNIGSLAAAQKWQSQTIGQYVNSLIRTRQTPPSNDGTLTVREAENSELDFIAHQLNDFYQDYNLYVPQSGQTLANWLEQSPFERPFRRYYVVVDKREQVQAGLAIAEQYRIVTMRVQRMPAPARALNHLVHMVPPDGVLRQISVNRIWFAPGQVKAARHLWESVRWQMRDVGSHLVCAYDPGSPIPQIIQPPFWLPKGGSIVVAQTPMAISDRPVCYP